VSADARVARAIKQIREIEADAPDIPYSIAGWMSGLSRAVDDLIDGAKDALHLSDDDIANH
jgi:hypothetical protein